MTAVVWEDPPSDTARDAVDVSGILAELMTRPGAWAKVHVGGGTGTSKRAGMLRKAGCQTRTTRADGGRRTLYARWLGPHFVEGADG